MENFPLNEHLEGFFEKAESKYLEYQIEYPENIELSFWLGYLYFQKGEFDKARKNIMFYLQQVPTNIKAWNLLGLIYKNLNELPLAIMATNKALEIAPNYYDALFNLATIYIQITDYQNAIDYLNQLTHLNDNDYEPLFLLGYCYQQKENYNLAIHFYNNSLQLNDVKLETYINLSIVYLNTGLQKEAYEIIKSGMEMFPQNEQMLFALANYYEQVKEIELAKEVYLNIIKINNQSYLAYFYLGNIYKTLWNLERAIEHYEKALELNSNDTKLWLNYGIVLHSKTDFLAAVGAFKKIIEIDPKNQEAYNNLGGTYFELGKYLEAIEAYKNAISINPSSPLEHFNLGMTLLLLGDLKSGFNEYEWRTKLSEFSRSCDKPKWDGSSLQNKTIFIYAEQGFGDIFQFVRFLPVIKKMGARIIFEVRKEVYNIVNSLNCIDKIILRGERVDSNEFDCYASLLSLPAILGIEIDEIPITIPYLFPDKLLNEKWEEYFKQFTKLKIGIVWMGNPFPIEHRKRHTQFKYFVQLAKLENVHLFSLQFVEDSEGELSKAGIISLARNFDETAAIIKNLDLVITIDTSIAHLAGALGKEVWILLTKIPDWRWMLGSKNTVWYPTAVLFRQNTLNNWQEVFDEVTDKLKERFASNKKSINKLTENEINRLKLLAFNNLEGNNLDQSIKDYLILIENDENDVESLVWLGTAYFFKNDFINAAKYLNTAKNIYPNISEEVYQNLSACYINLEDYDSALSILEYAIGLYPNSSILFNNLGLLFIKKKENRNAEQSFLKAIQNNNFFNSAWVNLINVYLEEKNYDLAIKFGLKALDYNKTDGVIFRQIADSYMMLNVLPVAELYYYESCKYLNDDKLFNNYAIVLQRQNKLNLAQEYFIKAINLAPNKGGYWGNLGNNYALMHDFNNATNFYKKAFEITGDFELKSRIGMLKLLNESFEDGWQYFDFSLKKRAFFKNLNIGKEYNGENLEGKTILVFSEQGLGDIIQFGRLLPLLKNRGCNILFEIPQQLINLYNVKNGYYQPVVRDAVDYNSLSYDYYVSLLSLPKHFCTNIANITNIAYKMLFNSQLLNVWKEKLKTDKFKVGIVWAGNPSHPNDHNRSIPLELFEVLFNNENIRFYFLQKEFGLDKVEFYTNKFNNIVNLSNELSDIETTASILLNMDLIITVDTMISHLAGSFDVPTLLLLPYLPDWRWLLKRDDSIWYSSIKIFRQPAPGDWISVIEKLNDYLIKISIQNENLALINQLTNLQDYDKAINLIKSTLESDTESKDVLLFELGKILLHTKDYAGAENIFKTAAIINNTNFELQYNIGYSCHMQNNLTEAQTYYKNALKLNPNHVNALNNLAIILRDQRAFAEAEKLLRKAIELNYNKSFLHNNLGTVIEAKGNLVLARDEFFLSITLNSLYAEGYMNLSNAEHYLGEFNSSLMHINKALEISPDNADAHFNKSLLLLRLGLLKEGFEEYEWRVKRKDYPQWNFKKPLLDNFNNIKGKTILVHDEQGYGDTIQFCRYISRLKQYECKVILMCHVALVELMKGCLGVDECIGRGPALDENINYDYRIPLLSLGTLFETTLTEMKVYVPYILIDQSLTKEWEARMQKAKKLLVGFVWRGKQTPGNEHRSCELKDFIPLFENKDISFVSLQVEDPEEEQKQIFDKYDVTYFNGRIKNFNDTAAIMSSLDLIISIDTSVAHLSGALGKETWILLSTKCDWRWYDNREDNPWYPTAVLFRQNEFNNWSSVFTEVDIRLKQRLNY